MKSNIEKVYSKLPKHRTIAHKIELGIVDEISKQLTQNKF